MKIDVLILYQHANRELRNACILKNLLEDEGLKVRISFFPLRKGIFNLKFRPRLIICPTCQGNNTINIIKNNYVGSYEKGSFQILNLYSEQLTSESTEKIIKIKDDALRIFHICWGKYSSEKLLDWGCEKNNFKITGSQRLDFVIPKFRVLCKTKEELSAEFNLDKTKKWVLIVDSFSNKNETNFDYLEQNGFFKIKELVNMTNDTYHELINWYKKLLQNRNFSSNIEFIYRPHPAETNISEVYDLAKEYSNFHVIDSYNISDWALNIDLAYIWNSTSSVELSVAGIPIISVVPFELKDYQKVRLIDTIEKVSNLKDLIELSDKVLYKNVKINADFVNGIKEFYEISNVSANERIVSFVKEILENKSNLIKSEFKFIKGVIKSILYLRDILIVRFGLKLNRLYEIIIRDYRSNNFINSYCNTIRKKMYG